MTVEHHERAGLRDYVRLALRRKWIILIPLLLVPAAALTFAERQPKLYQSSAEVLLSEQNLAAELSGASVGALSNDPTRATATQEGLARLPLVATRTLQAAGLGSRSPNAFLGASSVSASSDSDLVTFRVTDRVPAIAERLATAYARQYTIYRHELDTGAIKRARSALHARLRTLVASGQKATPLYQSLVEKDQQLETLEALQTSNAFLVRTADGAAQVQPRPVRSVAIGLGLGIFLGLGLAFLWEALDTRVRSAEEVRDRLGLPLLGRLPEPARDLRNRDRLVMLAEPSSTGAEAVRVLRTNLEFANLDRAASSVMITSAVQGEGKSTTIANLGVALARAGRHVVLADLDLRRPYLDRFFGIERVPGITQVALGQATIDEALVSVFNGRAAPGPANTPAVGGSLEVLPAGLLPPDPGEFVLTRAIAEILRELSERSDILLVDTPPLLGLGDAITLSERIDALILVTRLRTLRRPMLHELRRILDSLPATKLGFVVAAAETEEGGYGYGYGYRYSYRSESTEVPADAETVSDLAAKRVRGST